MKKITEIKIKFSCLLYSKLKFVDWVILNLKYYGPGAGTDHSASFHLGCCFFLAKLATSAVWTGTVATFLFGIMVLCHLRRADKPIAHISLYSMVEHRISTAVTATAIQSLVSNLQSFWKVVIA